MRTCQEPLSDTDAVTKRQLYQLLRSLSSEEKLARLKGTFLVRRTKKEGPLIMDGGK